MLNLKVWRYFYFGMSCIVITLLASPVYRSFFPPDSDLYLSMSILGEDLELINYYPENNLNISVGSNVFWSIRLSNEMGEVKYLSVVVKLVNSRVLSPDSINCVPSSGDELITLKYVLGDAESHLLPFSWEIINATRIESGVEISGLIINGHVIDGEFVSELGDDFKLIFELWAYDPSSGEFKFSIDFDGTPQCVWNQVIFNIS